MKSLRLLHVTDLHRKVVTGVDPKDILVDLKDKAIPEKYNNIVTDYWERNCIKEILQWERLHSKIDAIVCTGDLGNRGDIRTIEEGAAFLSLMCKELNIGKENMIVCPGNHDLERDKGDSAFDNFETALKNEGFKNFCTNDIQVVKIKNVSIFAANSCLGGTAQSLFIEKYKETISKLSDAEKQKIESELNNLCQTYMIDFLDIPIIGNEQAEGLREKITSLDDNDSAIILMHHNPYPNKSIECRPYCNIIDAGKFLNILRGTNKNIFILHGHIHFEDSIITFSPKNKNNFISSLGNAALNNENGSMVSILEFFFTDSGSHILTKVHKIYKDGSGFIRDKDYSICDHKLTSDQIKINYESQLRANNKLTFAQLSKKTKNPNDDDLLKVLLRDPSIDFDRNTEDYKQWLISKR